MNEPALTITVYDGTVGAEVLDEAVALYSEVYAEPPYLEGEKDFAGFADDLPRRAMQENFRLVVARLSAEPLGFALGHQLPTSTRWWEGAVSPLPADLIVEHPGRTFAVIELAVRKLYRRRGLARRIYNHLTAELNEERKTLLVRPDARAAQAAYSAWAYRKVGRLQPSSDAPIYDVMVSD